MLVAAAVCPTPAALVPAVAQGGAARLDDVRAASLQAVQDLVAAPHDEVWVVGAGPVTRSWGPGTGGSLRRHGVDVSFGGPHLALPESLTIGCFLLGVEAPRARFQALGPDAPPETCAAAGTALASSAGRVALLVMADHSARRTAVSPGPFDARAVAFDASCLAALVALDVQAMLALDPALCRELWVSGRVGWQALAGAVGASVAGLHARVRYQGAPLGVGYSVVSVERALPPTRSDGKN